MEDKIDQLEKERRDSIKELRSQLHTTQSKYTYFLLFIAASAIALVIKTTENDILSLSFIPLFLALLLWGYSFYCGCQYVISNADYIRTNINQYFTNNTKELDELDDTLNTLNISLHKYYLKQFHFLKWGAIFFFLKYLWIMIDRTF